MKSIIVYATKYGCAEEAAKRVQKELGPETELCNILTGNVPPLSGYDTVILGGSVYVGRVQKQITAFCTDHLTELLGKKVGLFLCAGQTEEDARQKELEAAFPAALLQHAAAKDILGYAFQFEKMKFLDKIVMKKIKGDSVSTAEYYGNRIARFAGALKS